MLPGAGDDLHISRQPCGIRDVKVSSNCPAGLQRTGPWRVEDFDLHKRLYQGKASLLYSATCKKSQIPVAVKVYRKARLSELNWYQVEREIRIHSQLSHENIIQLYAAFEDDTNVYMVQEYATGGDLYEDLKSKGGRFEEGCTAAHVLRPCISALIYLHGKGIIHRDIKPENILLMSDRSIKLADFGLSIDATSERPVTRAGTLDYMAPEVLLCPEKSRPQENKDKVLLGYTAMVDAWAMGILAYELIVGRPPFEKQSRAATYEHIMYRKPEFPANMSPDAKDFVFTALTKAARKRPALANMLSHRWLQLSLPRSASPSSAPSQASSQSHAQATPLLGPPGPLSSTATSPPGPSPLGLTPTEAPRVPITSPNSDAGRHHSGMSRPLTANEETSVSAESTASPSENSLESGPIAISPLGGAPKLSRVSTQRSVHSGSLPSNPSASYLKQEVDEPDDMQRQTTWTASLKRGMLKMLSKTSSSSSGRDSRSMQDAAAAAVASVNQPLRSATMTDQASGESQSGASRGLGGPGGVSLNVRSTNLRPQHANSFKGLSHSPSSALLSPIASQTSDLLLKSGKSAQSTNSVGASSADAEAAQARASKFSMDLASPSGQGKSWPVLASAGSGLKGNFQPIKSASILRLEAPSQGVGSTPQPFPLAPQPSQPVQTVQQMLAEMQSEKRSLEGAGGRQSPRNASMGLAAMTDSVSSIGEGRARLLATGPGHEPRIVLESPFADSLANKPFATSISRRYAMAGTNLGSGSSSNFTDYAGLQKGPADVLRGSTSYPLQINGSHHLAYPEATSSDGHCSEVPQAQMSTSQLERNAQIMTRSQSLALPADMRLEANVRSASNRNPYKRADIANSSIWEMSLKTINSDNGSSSALRASVQQQKGDKPVQKRRITKDQNIEPLKSAWAGQSALKEGVGGMVDSPRGGSGLIKVGLGQGFEEAGRK